jgi:hypothetical protein
LIMREHYFSKRWIPAAALATVLIVGCNNQPPQVFTTQSERSVPNTNATDTRRLSDGVNKLIDAMNTPDRSFRFSFKGQENINDNYAHDKAQRPVVGPVSLDVAVSALELDLKEKRGKSVKQSKATMENQTSWKMAHLVILRVMTKPNLVIAAGSTLAEPPANDIVGGTIADKYSFDTTTATGNQKRAFDMARLVVASVTDCAGTVWIAKDSGELVKFNVDANYLDQDGRAWKEHYEGVVTPK